MIFFLVLLMLEVEGLILKMMMRNSSLKIRLINKKEKTTLYVDLKTLSERLRKT